MEKMCNNSMVSGVRENAESNERTDEIVYQSSPKNFSPIFGGVNSVKNARCMPSPEDDIPSYQIPRDSKRFSDISEEQDSILPISPVCTPPSVKKFEDFEEPLIHTIGTVVKMNGGSKVITNEEFMSGTKQYPSALEELGILDKDISWNSSMETPAPHPLSLDDYNTIERATLLPENDLKSIQRRALFSPHKNDDSDCMPIKYSSESEDDGDDYVNGIQLSDKCQMLEDMTIVGELKDDVTLIASPKHCLSSNTQKLKELEGEKEVTKSPGSPVFKIKKNNKKSKAKKLRAFLVRSPIIMDADEEGKKINCDLGSSGGLTDKENDSKQNNSFFSEQSNSIQDDSFQNMSFSCIDELCKNSFGGSDCNITNNTDASVVSKDTIKSEEICNAVEIGKGKIQKNKFFYENTEKCDELQPVLSVDNFLKSAKRLEEGSNVPEIKTKDVFTNEEVIVFSQLMNEVSECDFSAQGVKRIRAEYSSEKSPKTFRESKIVKLDNCRDVETAEEDKEQVSSCDVTQDINSHFDANDSQMCLTAAFAESLINNADQSENNGTKNNQTGCNISNVDEIICDKQNIKFPMFSTALGNTISVSSDAYRKVQSIFKEDYEEIDVIKSEFSKTDNIRGEEEEKEASENNFQGFKTASGAAVKISEKSLSKAKNLWKEIIADEKCMEDPVKSEVGFSTASRSKIKISEESLTKARKILSSVDMTADAENSREDSTVMKDEVNEEPRTSGPVGFKTASNKQVKISKESLKKVEALWRGEEEVREELFTDPAEEQNVVICDQMVVDEAATEATVPIPKFCGFSTASGRNISVSNKALSKAKKLLGDDEERTTDERSTTENGVINEGIHAPTKEEICILPDNTTEKQSKVDKQEDSEELIPAWLHAYNTSPTLTMERLNLDAVTSHEDCQRSTPRERYLIKSPILATTDRFFNKRKRNPGRKLVFDPIPKLKTPKGNELKPNFNAPCKIGVRKRDTTEMDIDFAVPFKRRKINDVDIVDVTVQEMHELSEEVKKERRKARAEQIKAGKKGKVKPVKGSHLLKKSETQMTWSEAVQGAFPEGYSKETLLKHGIREDVIAVTASTAADFKFKSTDFFTSAASISNVNGFPVGDGCSLIFDDENKAGVEEFTAAFFASPGVEPNLISKEWVKNHYRWIVWKLCHYERAFPLVFGGKCLTPHNVLVQLKYRYDREIDYSQRSALKKILERDDSSAKRMVLCVCDIKKTSDLDRRHTDTSNDESLMTYKLGLTDGWYSCYAQTDPAMTRLVEEGKVFIGTKLVTQGAELLNCDKGVSPLEAAENLHLKISTNSTRRAKWNVKLGFQKNGGPVLVYLNSILFNGGVVGRVDVVIARIYPVLYMEKKPDGTHVTRNSRMEDRATAAYQQQQEAAIEKIYQQVKDELRSKEKERGKHGGKLSISDVKEVTDAEELYNLYEHCPDPSLFQTLLSSKQKDMLIDHQRRKTEISNKELSDRVQERIKAEKMSNRKVSQLLRIKIVDLHKPDYGSPVLFTVWNSMEDVSRIFSEGKAISIFNTTPGNCRFFNSIQLNSTRKTRYKELSQSVEYPARKLTHLRELTVDYEPVFNEVDIVGLVVAAHETSYGSRLSQTLFIADEEFNYAGIVFWGHCKDYGWENILTVNSIVACSNLQWNKKRNPNCIPSVYVNDTSVFTENPKQNFLKEEIKRLRIALPEDKKSYVVKCAEDIAIKLGENKNNSNLSKNSPIPNDSSSNLKPKYINGFKTKPNASSTPFKSACLGPDTSDLEPSPIQKRIEKLQMYGEPPPISPLLPLDNLEKFKSKFRVPFKNTVDSSSK